MAARRFHRLLSPVTLMAAVALTAVLAPTADAAASDRYSSRHSSHGRSSHHGHSSHFGHSRSRSSLSFSFGVGSHHSPFYSSHYYRSPSYRSYSYDYCPPPVIHHRYYDYGYSYTPNTAVVVTPPPQTVYVQQPAPSSTVITSPPVTYSYGGVSTPAAAVIEYSSRSVPTQDGWALLSADQPNVRAAMDAFALQAERMPDRGTHKIGYALTAALQGNDEKAAWAMRRAVLQDAESLKAVPVDGVVANHLRDLGARYEARLRDGFSRSDDAFMLASVRFIQREYTAAQSAIDSAVKSGDVEVTTARLKEMIEKFNTTAKTE